MNLASYSTLPNEWKVDLIPLRINNSKVLDLCYNDHYKHHLSKLGKYVRLHIDENEDYNASTLLSEGLPFEDKSIGFTCAYDILDHMEPQHHQFITDEIARVSNQACITYSSLEQNPHLKLNSGMRLSKGITKHELPNGETALTYNLPLIAVVGDGRKQVGGAHEVIENIKAAIRGLGFSAYEMYVNTGMSEQLPVRISAALWPYYVLKIPRQDVINFDAIVTIHPLSHHLRHPKHLIYFMHHQRVYYDLYPFFAHRLDALTKLGLMIVTRSVRFLEKRYFAPNLISSTVIAASQNVANRIMKYNKLTVKNVIYPGGLVYDASIKTPTNSKPIALSFSRIHVAKGIELVIDVARLLDGIEFIIAGAYAGEERIDENDLPSNVTLSVGSFSEEEKCNLYRNCNVFLAPYVDEDFGIAPIEANSFGKPVVYCIDSGGLLETQRHKLTGYMTERDPWSFADGIRYCILYAKEMKDACVENSKRFTWEKFRDEFATEIQRIILQ